MRVRRHYHQSDETGIDLAPMERTLPVMNLLAFRAMTLARLPRDGGRKKHEG